MKVYSHLGAAAIALAATLLVAPAQAQLLGGLLGGGSGGGTTITVPGVASVTVGGNNGLISVSGSSGGAGLDLGTTSLGVPDLAMVTTSSNSGGGTDIGVNLLGGGGGGLNLPVLGNNVSVGVPGLGGLTGGPGSPGAPGAPGINGISTGGPNIVFVATGNPQISGGPLGGNVTVTSSKLRLLAAVFANRNWMRFARGNKICLSDAGGYNVTDVSAWLPQKDWGGMQQLLATNAQDIYTLRTMLSNCRSNGALLSQADLNRVIGLDIGPDGRPVLYVL